MTAADVLVDMWSAVDYNPIATRETLVSELLVRAADVHHGERVLDVAAGTGNTALAAARRGAIVTATDLVPSGLETALRRAEVDGLELTTRVGDAGQLPFPDGTFDVVLSTFGVMYAPDQKRAADELVRVCRPGGRIGLVSWTPDGMAGRMQAGARAVAPLDTPLPTLWGTEEHCRRLLADRVELLAATTRTHEFCAASAEALVEFFCRHLPPFRAASLALPAQHWERMAAATRAEFDRANRATDGTLVACSEYLEVIARRCGPPR
jgi:ubiquinone/menaquinone biosynthesis C-methylase UbiE